MSDPLLDCTRVMLRPWQEDDATQLFALASNPNVGPRCGWPPHESVAESRMIIRNILKVPNSFAIVSKGTGDLIGAISLKFHQGRWANDEMAPELGMWLGEPHWGFGYGSEAATAAIAWAFDMLDCVAVWASYFDENEQALRMLRRLGFIYEETEPWVLTTTGRHTRHDLCLQRDHWIDLRAQSGSGRAYTLI